MTKFFNKSFLNWLLVFLWLGVIYFFSSQSNLKSALEPFWDFIFRKIAHMAEYFVLAYLTFRAYRSLNVSVWESLGFALIIAVLAAVADEFHQLGVKGRVGSPIDVAIDSVGTLTFGVMQLNKKYLNFKI